jgi:hypothetical protein
MGKWGIYNGANLKVLKSNFWLEKSTNICLENIKRCGIATFGGGIFLIKVDFVNIFMRKSRF